jgi:hypothetical protein
MISQWYELFYDNGEETKTIFSSEECKNVRNLRDNLIEICLIPSNKLHIDLWENPINPKIIEKII